MTWLTLYLAMYKLSMENTFNVISLRMKDLVMNNLEDFNKVRGSDSSHLLPSTSMAAHEVDDFIEAMEREEKSEAGDAILTFESGTGDNETGLAFLPPLPPKVMQSNYNQYQGEDEEVDVEEVDVDMGDADGNSDIEIEMNNGQMPRRQNPTQQEQVKRLGYYPQGVCRDPEQRRE
ncbi:hypothetical protein Taro_030821 [Colocasia esculenta]|uniref:Uncharacterized protein n=1 Tax=Colocasia esculenta TaxID=4460 RepID=A0A843VSX9_COLES|nr:hypothetical protein [Colocasia esculenta]